MKFDDDPLPITTLAAPTDRTPPRRRRRGRTLLWLALACVVCLAVLSGRAYYDRTRSTGAVQTTLNDLDRAEPGWRFDDLEAAWPPVADADNAALHILEVEGWQPHGSHDAGLHLRLLALPPNERPHPVDVERLRVEREGDQTALEKARELAELPHGRFTIIHERNPLLQSLPHLQRIQHVTTLLGLDALLQMEDGQMALAARDCRARFNAARSCGDAPYFSDQLSRIRWVVESCAGSERLLNQGEVDLDDLAALQRQVEEEERFPRLLVMLRAERASVEETLEGLESGAIPFDKLNAWGENHFPSLNAVYTKDTVRALHPEMLKRLTEAIAIAQLPAPRRMARIVAYEASSCAELKNSALSTLLPNLRWVNGTTRRTDARLRCLAAVLAVERYRRTHGRWPDTLADLVPDLLTAVPTDPANDEPLGYRCYADRAVVYSRLVGARGLSAPVGPPAAFNPDEPSVPGIGLAVHLFDVAHRHQASSPRGLPPLPLPPRIVP